MGDIQILDCTLRDGAYVVDARFGTPAIKGILKKLQDARADIIECGWLKDKPHEKGTTFYHVPSDLEQYLQEKNPHSIYAAMIDWDRYDLGNLPDYDGKSIDAIRVVFPQDKSREGIALGKTIREKGYQVYFQAANTLGYSDAELMELADRINEAHPAAVSVVDTFGAMFGEDLGHIVAVLDSHLDQDVALGFHAHNNQQLAFALAMEFINLLKDRERGIIVDSCLCGMGRGAGNAPTELMVSYMDRKQQGNYDTNAVLDAIDMYMGYFIENYKWGYSTPYFISGMYCAHVNNVAYLLKNHRTKAKDMKNIIESLPEADRRKYDYDLLEQEYLAYQDKAVDDGKALADLKEKFSARRILLLLPGKSALERKPDIDRYICAEQPVVVGVNAIIQGYEYDYIFFSNEVRYNYAQEIYPGEFRKYTKITASNIKTVPGENEMLVNFNLLVKRGWEHFDNSGIVCLRLLNKLQAGNVAIAGFDGFRDEHSENYADVSLPHISPGKQWDALNDEIKDMFTDFRKTTAHHMDIIFITPSRFGNNGEGAEQ